MPNLKIALTRLRGHRRLVAATLACASLVVVATPAHAALEAVYVIPGPVCAYTFPYQCDARTDVHVLLPPGYAVCTAELELTELSFAVDDCSSRDLKDAYLEVELQWDPGSCASLQDHWATVRGSSPLWSIGAQTDVSAGSTCSSIDYAITQSFSVPACSGTTFQVTADIRGNADGTYSSSYNVTGSGSCAGEYDIIAVEGPREKLNLQ